MAGFRRYLLLCKNRVVLADHRTSFLAVGAEEHTVGVHGKVSGAGQRRLDYEAFAIRLDQETAEVRVVEWLWDCLVVHLQQQLADGDCGVPCSVRRCKSVAIGWREKPWPSGTRRACSPANQPLCQPIKRSQICLPRLCMMASRREEFRKGVGNWARPSHQSY
eukprot:COSAG01_NODE_905_length_12840_cov_12.409544_9_plen_163_part_00